MPTRILLTILACIMIRMPAPAQTVYHVARGAVGASDSNDGQTASLRGGHGPFKTIAAAVNESGPGDQIIIHPGDYRTEDSGWGAGAVGVSRSGTKSRPIRLAGVRDNMPILGRLILDNCSWIEIRNLDFRNSNLNLPATWKPMPAMVTDSNSETIQIQYSEDWSVREKKISQKFATYSSIIRDLEYDTAIDLRKVSNVSIQRCAIDGYWAGIQARGAANLQIESNRINRCVNGIFCWEPEPSIVNSVIRGNQFTQSFSNAIEVRKSANNVLIENNQIKFTGVNSINLREGSTNCTVRGNQISHGGFYAGTMQYPGASAINVHTAGKGNVVENNHAYYQVDETGADGNGIIIDLMLDGASVIVRNNVCYRNIGAGINTTKSPNAIIVQNALIENGYKATLPRQGYGIKFSRDDDTNQTVLNNILCNNRIAGIVGVQLLSKQKQVDHNLYFSDKPTPLIWDGWEFGDREYRSLADLQKSNLAGAHSLYAKPALVEQNGLITIGRTKEVVDTGLTHQHSASDIQSTERPIGKSTDIGPVEFK